MSKLIWTASIGLFLLFSFSTASALDEQDAGSQSSGEVIGRIQISAIDVDSEIREGVAQSVIDQGVAHWAGSAMPGQLGNMILAGHRVTYKAPFKRLNELKPGDEIFIIGADGVRILYTVTNSNIVIKSNDRWILTEHDESGSRLTIFTCHPKGYKVQRLVIFAAHVPSPQLVD